MLQPYRFVERFSYYVVRAQPGQLDSVMKESQKRLLAAIEGVSLSGPGLFPRPAASPTARSGFGDHSRGGEHRAAGGNRVRHSRHHQFPGTQRRRQIGIRRAWARPAWRSCATSEAENFVIAAAGAVLGVALAVTFSNVWMAGRFEMARWVRPIRLSRPPSCCAGTISVLWPAFARHRLRRSPRFATTNDLIWQPWAHSAHNRRGSI